jgi:hypothetical protein
MAIVKFYGIDPGGLGEGDWELDTAVFGEYPEEAVAVLEEIKTQTIIGMALCDLVDKGFLKTDTGDTIKAKEQYQKNLEVIKELEKEFDIVVPEPDLNGMVA